MSAKLDLILERRSIHSLLQDPVTSLQKYVPVSAEYRVLIGDLASRNSVLQSPWLTRELALDKINSLLSADFFKGSQFELIEVEFDHQRDWSCN